MKKIFTLILLAAVAVVPFGAYADSTAAKIYVDTKQVQFTESTGIPFESANGRTMVPLRAVMEAFGADVGWDEQTNSAILTKDSTTLTVTVNSKTLKLSGGGTIVSDEAPSEINGRIYLPIRAVAEAFGGYVLWNEQLNSVFILNDEYFNFRDMFTYEGELSKYVNTVVVSATYNGGLSKDEFKHYWLSMPAEETEVYLKAVATDKKSLNPEYDIHINFWYPSDEAENSFYLASVSSFSYDASIYNPFDVTEINQLNQ